MPSSLSIRGLLSSALATVVAPSVAHPAEEARSLGNAPSSTLRLSRDPQDLAYLYRPGRLAAAAGEKSGAVATALDLASRWNAIPSPSARPALEAIPFPPSPALEAYLAAHTPAHPLAPGQLLLRPTATALGVWLWIWVRHCPPPPTSTAAVNSPFPHKQAPLAEALHLSPLALLQYTHMRCHRLTPGCPLTSRPGAVTLDPWDPALLLESPTQRYLWRALVALVDDLATAGVASDPEDPTPLSPVILKTGYLKGYHLCVAVDAWLREMVGHPPSPATDLLRQGIAQSLAHLLQGWLQVRAPTSL